MNIASKSIFAGQIKNNNQSSKLLCLTRAGWMQLLTTDGPLRILQVVYTMLLL
jgi:hypothetical protein